MIEQQQNSVYLYCNIRVACGGKILSSAAGIKTGIIKRLEKLQRDLLSSFINRLSETI